MTVPVTQDVDSVPQHAIGSNAPQSVPWNPAEIVYCRLTMTDPHDPSTAHFDHQNYVIDIRPGAADPIEAFIRSRLSDTSATPPHDRVYTNNDPAKGPCDVFVGNQCYFLLEIDHTLPWQFCTTLPCLTLKDSYRTGDDHHNFGLTQHSTGQFAWFGVAIRPRPSQAGAYTKQSFNIVLQSKGSATPTIYVIDPDSTNDGTIPPANP